MFTKTARTRLAAALAFGSLGLAAPALAAPVGLDAGLRQAAGDVVTVQYGYGYGYGPRHHGFGGFGPRHHHHGWGRGHRYGWRHHGFGPRPHHHGGFGHRHGYGRW